VTDRQYQALEVVGDQLRQILQDLELNTIRVQLSFKERVFYIRK
jgi:hypothetical protein